MNRWEMLKSHIGQAIKFFPVGTKENDIYMYILMKMSEIDEECYNNSHMEDR